MRILLTNFHDGDGGGHTTYVVALAKSLAARHAVHVAAPPGSRLYREVAAIEGVTTHAQAFPNGLNQLGELRAARRSLRALLRDGTFDLVHVNGSADHRLVLSALRGISPRPKLLLTKHNSKPMRGLGHWLRARRTDQVIAVSDHTRRELEQTSYAHRRIAMVHNGVDVARYTPYPDAESREARRRWIGDDTALVLGSNAGTAAYKGWMDLVEALALLPLPRRAAIHVLLAGKPPSHEAIDRIAALGLRDQVHFAGLLDDVRPMIAAIDAGFVLSYDVETISFACREMMAMGKPALVSDYAGLPENIAHGVDGWIVPVRDRDAIAAALVHLLDARDALPAMGRAACAKAGSEFGVTRFVERTERVYLDLLEAASARN